MFVLYSLSTKEIFTYFVKFCWILITDHTRCFERFYNILNKKIQKIQISQILQFIMQYRISALQISGRVYCSGCFSSNE